MASEKPVRWWTTLPGMLTALAAVITAGTGLVVGLYQVGLLGASTVETPSPTVVQGGNPVQAVDGSSTPSTSSAASTRGYRVTLPFGQKFQSGNTAYEILKATTRPDADGKLALTLSVRMINDEDFGVNFWDSSFRLTVGEDTYPASGGLNDIAESHATKVGNVLFVIPDSTRKAVLTIRYFGGTERTIPFELRPL